MTHEMVFRIGTKRTFFAHGKYMWEDLDYIDKHRAHHTMSMDTHILLSLTEPTQMNTYST